MPVNKGGNLSTDYFIAYIKLVANARNYSLAEAQDYFVEQFFNGDLNSFGKYSYANYMKAVEELNLS